MFTGRHASRDTTPQAEHLLNLHELDEGERFIRLRADADADENLPNHEYELLTKNNGSAVVADEQGQHRTLPLSEPVLVWRSGVAPVDLTPQLHQLQA